MGRGSGRRRDTAGRCRITAMLTRRLLLVSLAVSVLAAACASATASPAPTAGLATSTPAATLAPSPATPTPAPTATPSAVPSATIRPLDPDDWPVYHGDNLRTGNRPGFPKVTGPLRVAWTAKLDGAVYAEPLVVHSRVVAATEGDSVYTLDPITGDVVWMSHLGTPVRKSTLPCGNIDPLGITGTPAYDVATNTIFAVAEVAGPAHVLFALNADDGSTRWSRSVDLPGDDPRTHQQRAALAIANGTVYVGFGGLAGDCGQYVGELVGVPVTGVGDTISYRVPVQREGAIWATGGPVVDADGNLYVSTGNGSSTTRFDGSDSVVKLSPKLEQLSIFAPGTWAFENAHDKDLGSLSPALTPNGFVFIAGKSGIGYVLRKDDLGGIGGQVSQLNVCNAFGGTALEGNDVFFACGPGTARVAVHADGTAKLIWKASVGIAGAPVIGGGVVWTANETTGVVYVLDEATGKTISSLSLGALPHFVSPALWRDTALVGTMAGVTALKG
jgi:outer membrane protein assembly factor BamB